MVIGGQNKRFSETMSLIMRRTQNLFKHLRFFPKILVIVSRYGHDAEMQIYEHKEHLQITLTILCVPIQNALRYLALS